MFTIHAGQHIIHGTYTVYMTHFLNQPQLRLRPQSCNCANGNNFNTIDLLMRFSFYVLLARLGPLALQIFLVQSTILHFIYWLILYVNINICTCVRVHMDNIPLEVSGCYHSRYIETYVDRICIQHAHLQNGVLFCISLVVSIL